MRNQFIFIFLFFALSTFGQSSSTSLQYKFRVSLKDKGQSAYTLQNPTQFLTQKSIDRKQRQNVTIDETDLPISPDYFNQLELAGATVVTHSKWFKTITVQVADSLSIQRILTLPFVDTVQYVWRGKENHPGLQVRPRLERRGVEAPNKGDNFFGVTEKQFEVHNAKNLILAGFQGKGIEIGVIDAGFTNFDVIPWFENVDLRGYVDFVPLSDMFASSSHGTKVLSTMAICQPGVMMGSAPEAAYWLMKSEDVRSEFPVEEDYWVRAIEYADSLGIDVINTSLGYNNFDDEQLSYRITDLTGDYSFMSRAANKAFDKGMLIVTSAGNEGNKPWRKITPPADAKNAITVGAIGVDSLIASFSSHGFLEEGRVKPDVVSIGRATVTIGDDGLLGFTNGTSLSSPFMAGLIASLWSVNPNLHRQDLIDIVKQSSDRYLAPDSIFGNGIPNFQLAMRSVLATLPVVEAPLNEASFSVDRPTDNEFLVTLQQSDLAFSDWRIYLLNESGDVITTHILDQETLRISLPAASRRNSQHVHLLIKSPYRQKVYRFSL